MDISDQYFDLLSERYFNKMKYDFYKKVEKSRDKLFSLEIQKLINNLFHSFYNEDEQTKYIIESFNIQYKLGYSINIIIENLKPSILKYKDFKLAEQNQDLVIEKKYFKFFWLFNTDLIKQIKVKNKKGNIISQYDYLYDFSVKNLKLLFNAQNKQERHDIFSNIIQKKHDKIVNNIILSVGYFNFKKVNDDVIFKAFVKYHTLQCFLEWLTNQKTKDQTNEQIKVKKSNDQSKIKLSLKSETEIKNSKSNKIIWNTDNSNFYRLVYALYHSKKIENGNGEITLLVENLACNFSISLKKSWHNAKTNAFKYKNNGFSNNDYFTKLNSEIISFVKNNNFDEIEICDFLKQSKFKKINTTVKWTAKNNDFYLLVTALYYSKSIDYKNETIEEIFLKFALIFDFNLKNEDKIDFLEYLNKIKTHQIKIELFETLKFELDKYINK